MSGPRPILEFDAELEARVRFADQVILIDTEQPDDIDDRRDRRLTDPDGPDFGRLDQTDTASALVEELRQDRSRHPSGGSPPTMAMLRIGSTGTTVEYLSIR